MASNLLYYATLRQLGTGSSQAPAAAAQQKPPAKAGAAPGEQKPRQPRVQKPKAPKAEAASSSSSSSPSSSSSGQSKDKVTFSVKKSEDFHEWYEQILRFAEIMDKRYPVKGMPVFRPYGFFIHNKIMSIIGEEWEKQGIEQALFPLLIPEKFLSMEADHVAGFTAEVYWVTHGGEKLLEERRSLRPTSETAMYYMFAQWIRSFRDLPLKVHQTCNVFRYETQQTRPLIRAREIHWNEAHTAHADKEEALENLEMAWRSYLYLINDCCCFYGLRLRRPEWDKFPGSEHTDVMDTIMPCGKVLQTVGAHYLGQKFSKVFDIKFLSRENVQDYAHITCYGISTRLLAALLSLHGDDQGLVIPPILARYQVVIVPITAKDPAAVLARCREIKQLLQAANVRVLLDDGNESSGEKFYHWEMKGVPIRIEVGPRDVQNNRMVVCCRDTRTKADVDNANLIPAIQKTMEDIQARLQANARAYHESMVRDVATVDELKAALLKGGFARFPFYSMGKDGEEGDKLVHELTGGEVRGSRPNEPAPPAGTLCVITGRPAASYAYAARSY